MSVGRRAPTGLVVVALAVLACRDAPERPAERHPAPFRVSYGPWVVQERPALPRGPAGAWDSGLVDPGAMIFHAGLFHMLYNGIPRWPHPLAVGWATSADGKSWERRTPDPVFRPNPVPFGGWTVRATSVIVEDDRWILYFAVGGEGHLQGRIGRATAASPAGPWTVDADPVLEPGPPGAWDDEAVGHAKVLPDAIGYIMYYTGWGGGPSRIGRAVSEDGIRWTKDPAPVLEPPTGEDAEERFQVGDPTVVRTPNGAWLMVHRVSGPPGDVVLDLASSDDGRAWRIEPGDPVTRLGPGSPLDMIFYSNVISTQQAQWVYYEGQTGGGTDVWVATRSVTTEAVTAAPPGSVP